MRLYRWTPKKGGACGAARLNPCCDGRLTWTYSEVKLLSRISRMVGTCFSIYVQKSGNQVTATQAA